MTMLRMASRASMATASADRIITVTCSTETLGRDDIVLLSDGIDLMAYRTNPVVLFQHNPDWPVARAIDIGVLAGDLVAKVRFPPEGVSARADEVYGLIQAGVINAASTGFETREAEPIDPAKPRDGTRITRCELQEFSFVSIPAVPDALITARALQEAQDKMTTPVATTEQPDPRVAALKTRMIKRGLYEVGSLAYLLMELGWIKDCAEWEADCEQDGSTVPAQLGAALQSLGATLVAMTTEEVAELVGGIDVDPIIVETPVVEGDIVTLSALTPVERFRLGVSRARDAHKVTVRRTPAVPTSRGMGVHRRMAALYERELRA